MPSPGTHNIESFVDNNRKSNKGFKFGASHETYAKVYNKHLPEKKGWTEPGLYDIKSFVDHNNDSPKKIFFGSSRNSSLEKSRNTPGPG